MNQKNQQKGQINIQITLIYPSFQGVIKLFVLPFEKEAQRISFKRYYVPAVEIKNCNIIDGQNIPDQTVRKNLITYDI